MSCPVSCVIPVFNGERFLAAAIDSVLAQSLSEIEIIVVDDGSTDGTRDVLDRFGARVVYIHQANAGPASARNNGIRHASGEFIAFLDSDDLWHPEKTVIQLSRFATRANLAICTAHMQNFWAAEVAHEIANLPDERLTEIQPNLGSSFMAPLLSPIQCFVVRGAGFRPHASLHKVWKSTKTEHALRLRACACRVKTTAAIGCK